MAIRLAALGFGAVFGFMISWGHFTDPDAIRAMLLLEDAYLWKMFVLAVAVGFVGVRLVRGRRARLTGEPIAWATLRPERRHVTGALLFGAGWGLSNACPAPVAAQLAQGMWWSLCVLAGIAFGVHLYARHGEQASADAGPDTPGLAARVASR
ncbi:MAG TPA: DUF6691 family protein [Solirubrobacteraceae bacterium]|nr:DUF6691 family protein [Solirubrobacteraceae bacterium]